MTELNRSVYVLCKRLVGEVMEEATLRAVLKSNRLVRFGSFELWLDTAELKKHGVRVRLQSKPFQILCALLECPGHVVTREELRNKLWSSDTFVDFESGLNTAVNRLRVALGDSADNPIYIETLARLGYRFIVPITVISEPQNSTTTPANRILQSAEDKSFIEIPDPVATTRHHSFIANRLWLLVGIAAALSLISATAILWALLSSRPESVFHQVTFRKGSVDNARFTSAGESVVYSARWNGAPNRLFLTRAVGSDARDLGFEKAQLVSVSPSGELAILAPANDSNPVLEAVSLLGGTPRVLSDSAKCADWGPADTLAMAIGKDGVFSIEYPPGHRLYTSKGWIDDVRVSPHGDKVAFAEHPIYGDDAGQVVVVDTSRRARVLSPGWGSLDGIAWRPSEREVWFTAARSGVERALMAVDMNARTRQVAQIPGGIQLRDIAASGKVLIARTTQRMIMFLGDLSKQSLQDISWLDWSHAVAMTPDGKNILFDETGGGGGKQYSVFIDRAPARSAERIGDGRAMDLSDDGRWALTTPANDTTKLSLVSVASHQSKLISGTGLPYRWARFAPGAKEILFAADCKGDPAPTYRQRVPDGKPILMKTSMGLYAPIFDPTGQMAVAPTSQSKILITDLVAGTQRSIENNNHLLPVVFTNKHEILVSSFDNGAIVFDFLDLATGKLRPYSRVEPTESTGMSGIFHIFVAKDLRSFVFSRQQSLTDLFVVSGWN